ncbi:39S ribosomal protein L38, mitochondrial [Araneus ventricosus]|uniref:Large ribosomal subunit protein mL38 n=1 Tax=Araneus ventricosus TaxID=182803 RepID=A0A4Y2P9E9_ARAVE|nr:39S ribosomal protein L38, mitochondrial [Araneus ventricosus]
MSAVCAAGNSIKSSVSKQFVKDIFLTHVRYVRQERQSRWLGYYFTKLSTPVYLARKENYRKTVLKPLEEIPSLEERLKELNAPDPVLDERIDIGFAKSKSKNVDLQDRLRWRKLCKASQKLYIDEDKIQEIDLSAVKKEWSDSDGLEALRNVADHYGIFSDMYQHGYFTPHVPLTIRYDYDDDYVSPVHSGNILQASEVTKAPHISFDSKPDDLWTLVLTNLDGHLLNTNSEYLHWFIGNIKGNNVKSGEVVCDYLQPFPMRGSGYHRLVFVLYKQKKKLDLSSMKKPAPCLSLKERTFKTFDFYKEHQDFLTPAGLAFYQCTWDESLTDFFHNVLNMQEPVFEYIEKPLYYRPQVHFPHLEPFNKYLDRYRDPKEIKKEVLLKRLKTIEPFKEEPPMPKYPCLHKPDNYLFSWQKRDMMLERLRLGKYRDLRPHSAYPQEDNQFTYWIKA